MVFNAVILSLITKNPLGCTSYRTKKKNTPPVSRVREMYTAKFAYEDAMQKRVGVGYEMYNYVEGYQYGIAAVISTMANIAAHRGKIRHLPDADHSVILNCHDPNGELYFLSLARDRVTISSYSDDAIRPRVAIRADSVLALA